MLSVHVASKKKLVVMYCRGYNTIREVLKEAERRFQKAFNLNNVGIIAKLMLQSF